MAILTSEDLRADRLEAAGVKGVEPVPRLAGSKPAAPARATTGGHVRWSLATLSVGAAVLHFAVVPARFADYWAYGVFLAVVAWAQLAWAVALVVRPSRTLLFAGLLDAVVIGVWALSRTAGVGVGPDASIRQAVGYPDALATALEAAVVGGCLVLAYRPTLALRPLRLRGRASGLVVSLALVLGVGITASLTPRFVGGRPVGGGAGPVASIVGGGHVHGSPANPDELAERQPDKPLDAATRATLAAQLVATRLVASRYPTAADAEHAGFVLAGKFAPGVGAHYIGLKGSSLTTFDLQHPLAYIYDGISPTSRVVGVMYYLMTEQPPEGFAGPNDHWHRHRGVCMKYGASGIEIPLPADADVTRVQCRRVGGSYLAVTGWMLHAWVVPGWESPAGVFSHSNPDLHCADGTDRTDPAGFCAGT